MSKRDLKRDVQGVHSIPLMNLGDRLRDPSGEASMVRGNTIWLSSQASNITSNGWFLTGLKSFAMDLRTISLTRSYQPNASWSWGSMKEDEWKAFLDKIMSLLLEEA
ncbi:MAG: hypothetical protein NWE88_10865 [Candidatus Bathyarchaeota archaeon]|nr:hypothetical protein [Candidatus Bathyarchaeota archaeon]